MDLLGRIRDEMALEGNIWKSYVFRFLWNFQLWWPIWVIYLQKERGLSLTQITVLDVPFLLLVVLAEVPTGAIADRFGRRISLMLGGGLYAIAVFTFGVADNYPLILLSYTAWGLGITFQSGADTALLYDSLKTIGREDDFQKINSRMWALTSLAVLIAILVGAPIAAATSFTFAICLSAVIAAIGVPIAWSMHEPRTPRAEGESERYLQTVANGVVDAWRQPALRYVILFSGVLVAATYTPLVFVQPFLDQHGVGTADLGLWQAPVRVAGVLAALLAYQFVSRLGERGAFAAMPVALSIAMFSLAGIDSLGAYGVFLLVGMVAGVMNPALATYVNRRIPSERRATMLSVQNVVGNFLLAGMQPFSGMMADTFGLRGMFLTFGAMIAVLGSSMYLLWYRAESAAPAPEGEALQPAAPERPSEPVAV